MFGYACFLKLGLNESSIHVHPYKLGMKISLFHLASKRKPSKRQQKEPEGKGRNAKGGAIKNESPWIADDSLYWFDFQLSIIRPSTT